jgi:GNAT superfamily N-acetyltransferase
MNVGETEGMDFSPEPVLIEVLAPGASAASQILRSYIDDVASRYYGRQATDEEIDVSLREDPSIDLALPSGVFLVARQRDAVLGCAGLRFQPEGVGEVKRLFVTPAARGIGLGARPRASWNASPAGTACQYCAWTPATTSSNPAGCMRPSGTRRCPHSTTAGTPNTGWQSRWPSGRWREGCTRTPSCDGAEPSEATRVSGECSDQALSSVCRTASAGWAPEMPYRPSMTKKGTPSAPTNKIRDCCSNVVFFSSVVRCDQPSVSTTPC